MTLTLNITEAADLKLLYRSITGYRSANNDLDSAIEEEHWPAIDNAQSHRQMHAYAIALIVNKLAIIEGGHP